MVGLMLVVSSGPASAQSEGDDVTPDEGVAAAADELQPCPRFGTAPSADESSGSDASSVEDAGRATACEPLPVEVSRVGLMGVESSDMYAEVYNPNRDFGLVRSGFELAFLDETGGILIVEGQGGVDWAKCCTIYQLPPGGAVRPLGAAAGRRR